MSKKEFLHSTMRDVNIRIENYKEEKEYEVKKMEHLAWMTGAFMQHAIAAAFSKKAKYPESPLKEKEVVVEDMELTEEEKEEWRKRLLSKLHGMAQKHNSKNN